MVAKFKKNRKTSLWQKPFSFILILILFSAIIGFLVFTNIKIARSRFQLTDRITNLKKEIEILEGKKKELEVKISQGGTEEYLEKVAREQLGLKAPGEEVVVIQKEKTEKPESEKKSWWEIIKSIWGR